MVVVVWWGLVVAWWWFGGGLVVVWWWCSTVVGYPSVLGMHQFGSISPGIGICRDLELLEYMETRGLQPLLRHNVARKEESLIERRLRLPMRAGGRHMASAQVRISVILVCSTERFGHGHVGLEAGVLSVCCRVVGLVCREMFGYPVGLPCAVVDRGAEAGVHAEVF